MSQRFYSTKSPGDFVDVKEAVLPSLPADNGLFLPDKVGTPGDCFWDGGRDFGFSLLGFRIARQGFCESIPAGTLEMIVAEGI
nr:threonine synthase [Verrucomicrobiaceae bacterium]